MSQPKLKPLHSGLLLIDIQQGFNDPTHWGTQRSTPHFEGNIAKLLAAFRAVPNASILHVCHHSLFTGSPLHPSKPGVNFMPYAAPLPNEPVFSKTTNSPFIETDLERVLKDLKLDRLVIAGLMTAHCVATTLRMASNLRVVDHPYGCIIQNAVGVPQGELVLVSDGTATYNVQFGGKEYDAETVHAVHLASSMDEFCEVQTTEQVIEALRGWKKSRL
jgi:nicotinamidase-related amidase